MIGSAEPDKEYLRAAQPGDRDDFLILWEEMLKENEALGGRATVSMHNVNRAGHYFDSYVTGTLLGVVLVVEDRGEIFGFSLGGDMPLDVDARDGKPAFIHGVYVREPYRRKGYALEMQRLLLDAFAAQGFTIAWGEILFVNVASLRMHKLQLGAQPYSARMFIPLRTDGAE